LGLLTTATAAPVIAVGTNEINASDNSIVCGEYITMWEGTAKFNDIVPVCLVLSNTTHSYKTVFHTTVDEYTVLEVDGSWLNGGDFYGQNVDLQNWRFHVEIFGQRSELLEIQGTNDDGTTMQVPFWTITAQVDNGRLLSSNPLLWDNDGGTGCLGGCAKDNCVSGFCATDIALCNDATDDCDIKVYFGWYGTDVDGRYLTSASKRLSAFRSWSLNEVFQSASQYAQNNVNINPEELINEQLNNIEGDINDVIP
jgi:hypothetical protein